jgi:cyclopropane fatty-acyl-phospholipid synthase-like methyltransferase
MSFDRLAPHYRWLERLLAGGVLQKARLTHLAALDNARNILLLGEGPGRFLETLRARRPDVPITVVDHSAAMLAEARSHVPDGPTTWEQADLLNWQPPTAAWDAVVSHCVLDCFTVTSLAQLIPRLAGATTARATWLITDFALPPAGWQRWRAHIIHTLMYGSFRLATGLEAQRWVDPGPWLASTGFRLRHRQAFSHGLIRADRWQRP